MPSCSPTMGTLMCQDVLFNTGLGKITLTHLSTAFRMGWLEWCKNTIFWAGVCWFYDQRKGSQLNYNLTHKVETALAGSAFFLGQFFHQSLVPPSLPRSLSQAGRCVWCWLNDIQMVIHMVPVWIWRLEKILEAHSAMKDTHKLLAQGPMLAAQGDTGGKQVFHINGPPSANNHQSSHQCRRKQNEKESSSKRWNELMAKKARDESGFL